MRSSLEDLLWSVMNGLFAPGVGSAELLLGLLVAMGFAWSALKAAFRGRAAHHADRIPGRHA